MSCTAVFSSSYAHLFSHWGLVPKGHPLDLSLAIMGMGLYGAYFVAACLWRSRCKGPSTLVELSAPLRTWCLPGPRPLLPAPEHSLNSVRGPAVALAARLGPPEG